MKDENDYKPNTSIYNGAPANSPEREAAKRAEQRARRAALPKFTLAEGESFYVPKETIQTLHREYLELFDELKSGFAATDEETFSLMQSVLRVSYDSEIRELQRAGAEKAAEANDIKNRVKRLLTPGYERVSRFSRRVQPNKALRQRMEMAKLAAEQELSATDEEIKRQSGFVYGETTATDRLYWAILETFLSERKQARFNDTMLGRYLMQVLTEYAGREDIADRIDELAELIADELVPSRRKEKFMQRNGKYLKSLLKEYLLYYDEPEEPGESDESEDEEQGGGEAEQTEVAASETGEEEPEAAEDEEAVNPLDELDELLEPVEDEPEEPAEEAVESEDEPADELVNEPVQEELAIVFVPQSAPTGGGTVDEQAENGGDGNAEE